MLTCPGYQRRRIVAVSDDLFPFKDQPLAGVRPQDVGVRPAPLVFALAETQPARWGACIGLSRPGGRNGLGVPVFMDRHRHLGAGP